MEDSSVALYIGLMAGSIFFIDGWGPTEKSKDNEKKGFAESRRFRGLSVLIVGGIITPVLDYVSKNAKPDFFLAYLRGCIYGWFFVLLFGLLLYLFWSVPKQKNKEKFWYKAGEFAYSILDFVYLGISDNPHLNAKRKSDVTLAESIYKLEGDHKLKGLEEKLANADVKPNEMDKATKKIIQQFDEELKHIKKESEYTFDDWYYKGIFEFENGEYEKTIAYMKNALEEDKNNANIFDAYLYIGTSYANLKAYEKAIEQYDKIILNYPKHQYLYLAHYNKGVSLLNLEQYEEALKENEKSIELNDNSKAWGNMGVSLSKLGRIEESIIACEKAIEKDPNYTIAWFNTAAAYAIKKDKEKLIFYLKKAIEMDNKYKAQAIDDNDFKAFWADEDFKKLVA